MRRFSVWFVAFVCAVAPIFASANTFEDGLNAFDKRDYEKAKAIWLVLAAQDGQTAAQYNLAVLFDEGIGSSKDPAEAAKWFAKAAAGGDLDASLRLASMRQTGLGVAQDNEGARQLLGQILLSPLNDANARKVKVLARQQLANLPVNPNNIIAFDAGRYVIDSTISGECMIALQGRITRETNWAFSKVVDKANVLGCKNPWILLESGGGSLFDGIALAKEVRTAGFRTMVRGNCASACSLMFMAGIERVLVGSSARIGFHQVASVRGTERFCSIGLDSNGSREVRSLVRWLNAEHAAEIFDIIQKTSCDSITWLAGENALRLGVATNWQSPTLNLLQTAR